MTMKIKYEFEIIDMGDEIVAVPVGESVDAFHGMLRLNADAAEMLRLIITHDTPDQVLEELCRSHPQEARKDLGQALCDYLNQLVREGILQP